jgi:hypothetical protein
MAATSPWTPPQTKSPHWSKDSSARENFDISALPEEALNEINRIQTRKRLNEVVKTGVPGFIAQGS